MLYHIYQKSRTGSFTKLGSTLYLEDAKSILDRWGSGYIVNASGAMVVEKNL